MSGGNPNHDRIGRFSSGGGGGAPGHAKRNIKSPKHVVPAKTAGREGYGEVHGTVKIPPNDPIWRQHLKNVVARGGHLTSNERAFLKAYKR